MQLINIPTAQSGPIGIVLSPEYKRIWVTEIIANKIASLKLK